MAIVSSTGGEGLAKRQDNRWYLNKTDRVMRDAAEVSGTLDDLGRRWWRRSGRRDVVRGLATEGVVGDLIANPQTRGDVEVAFPVSDNTWYLNAARRYGRRNPLASVAVMRQQIAESRPHIIGREEVIQTVLDEGHTFLSSIPRDRETRKELNALWGRTFGWTRRKIDALAGQLEEERGKAQSGTWFSAIRDRQGRITAAAMAERIDLAGHPFVESTEWRSTERDHMKAVADHLHAQVIDDCARAGQTPTIFAECNINSRAYRAGQKAGMVVPDGRIGDHNIPQILVQNVRVDDGREPRGRLRDFVFMHLPQGSYPVEQARRILAMTGGGR